MPCMHRGTSHGLVTQGVCMTEDEIVTLRVAAKRIGRTVDTLRRWRRDGLLEFEEHPDRMGRALVSMGALLAVASRHAKETRPAPNTRAGASPGTSDEALAAVRAHLADALAQRDSLTAELKQARSELAATRERLLAVERELNGGVRGFLRGLRL